MSPAQLAAEALQDIHSAKSSHDLALLGRPRRGALNPQVKPQKKPQGCGWRGLIHGLLLGLKLGPYSHPSWVSHCVLWDVKHLMTPDYNTDDAPKEFTCISLWYVRLNKLKIIITINMMDWKNCILFSLITWNICPDQKACSETMKEPVFKTLGYYFQCVSHSDIKPC